MKKIVYIIVLLINGAAIAQSQDTTTTFTKRVLENAEV